MAGSPIPPPPSEAASPPGCQRNRLARSRPPRAFGWIRERRSSSHAPGRLFHSPERLGSGMPDRSEGAPQRSDQGSQTTSGRAHDGPPVRAGLEGEVCQAQGHSRPAPLRASSSSGAAEPAPASGTPADKSESHALRVGGATPHRLSRSSRHGEVNDGARERSTPSPVPRMRWNGACWRPTC